MTTIPTLLFTQNPVMTSFMQMFKDASRSGRVVYSAELATCGTDARGFEPQTSTNVCRNVCRYVDRKGSAATLTSVQSPGVEPEVNLRNSLPAANKAHKQGVHPGFETQERRHQKSKTGVSVPPRKGLMSYKIFLEKEKKRRNVIFHAALTSEATKQARMIISRTFIFSCSNSPPLCELGSKSQEEADGESGHYLYCLNQIMGRKISSPG